ncbi:MAG: hypothetical protein ACRCVJ_11930 [Clostridium sp.]|uniref:hypothetical protein n=1 Tax=Clostridium sp. TaxID=1506 RepID=UPI003F385592
MEITNFISQEMLITFSMTLVIVELFVSFTKNMKFINKIPTKTYTFILACLHLVIINTETEVFAYSLVGYYLLIVNALIIAVILTGGYNIITNKITINKNEITE